MRDSPGFLESIAGDAQRVKNYRKFDAIFTTGESRGNCMT
jgi:hypothetical protein